MNDKKKKVYSSSQSGRVTSLKGSHAKITKIYMCLEDTCRSKEMKIILFSFCTGLLYFHLKFTFQGKKRKTISFDWYIIIIALTVAFAGLQYFPATSKGVDVEKHLLF